jgi:anti-anti-sigma factor
MLRYVGDKTPKTLVVSFKEVQRFSSENFGALLDMNNLVKANNGEVRLCEISDQIRDVFEVARLDTQFEIHGSVPGAMDQFK